MLSTGSVLRNPFKRFLISDTPFLVSEPGVFSRIERIEMSAVLLDPRARADRGPPIFIDSSGQKKYTVDKNL